MTMIPSRTCTIEPIHLETKLNTASENGLFQHQDSISHQSILNEISKGLELGLNKELTPAEYTHGIIALDTAQMLFDSAIESVSFWRRLEYVYGFFPLTYLLGILLLILSTVLWQFPNLSSSLAFLTIPKKILVAGQLAQFSEA